MLGGLTLSMIGFSVSYWQGDQGRVLSVGYGWQPGGSYGPNQNSVNVTAQIEGGCYIVLRVFPEKRIPLTGNWSNQILVDVFGPSGNFVGQFNTTTNNQGYSPQLDVCSLASGPVPSGNYVLRVKGFSHLRMRFPPVQALRNNQTFIDLTTLRPPLLAGETSIVFDNFINGLDLSTQSEQLYTGSIKDDLNRDGIVNSLDLIITIFNIYKLGEN